MTTMMTSANLNPYTAMNSADDFNLNFTALPFNPEDIRTTGENTSFIVTNDAIEWVQMSFIFTAVYLAAYHKMPQVKASYRQLAWGSLLMSLFLVIPFAAYMVTGITWTGMNLNAVHRRMIDSRHRVVMFAWMICSIIQLASYLLKRQKIHNVVGKLVINYLCPLIFLELFGNAVFVFWPEKPHVLAMGVHAVHGWPIPPSPEDLSNYEAFFLYTMPSLFALTTPVTMVMYYWLSNQALDRSGTNKRDVRLHVTYMICFIYSCLAAGSLRWLIRKSFQSSNCIPQTDTAISALMQFMGQAWTGYVYTLLLTAVYVTLPMETRQNNKYVKWSFYYYMGISAFVTPIAGWWAGVPAGIQCIN